MWSLPLTVEPVCAVVLFGFPAPFVLECQLTTKQGLAQFVAVRDLQAACRVLAKSKTDVIVGSTTIRPWDRTVLIEHAIAAGVTVEWADPNEHDQLEHIVYRWTQSIRTTKRGARRRER